MNKRLRLTVRGQPDVIAYLTLVEQWMRRLIHR